MKRILLTLGCLGILISAFASNGNIIYPNNNNGGGTITGVVAGTGLTGGGTSGTVTLNATNVGTITAVNPGTNMSGGGSSGAVTVSVTPAVSLSTVSIVQNSATPTVLTNSPLQLTGATNSNIDLVLQNQTAGNNAKMNFKILSDNGTSNLVESLRSSQYNQSAFSITPSTWGMITTNEHGLAIGAGTSGIDTGADLVFFTSAPVSSNAWWRMSPDGAITVASSETVTSPNGFQTTYGITAGSATINGNINAGNFSWNGSSINIAGLGNGITASSATFQQIISGVTGATEGTRVLVMNGNATILPAISFQVNGTEELALAAATGTGQGFPGAAVGDVYMRGLNRLAIVGGTSGSTTTPGLTVNTSEFVGIGNSTPLTRLHMSSGTFTIDGTNPSINIKGNSNTSNTTIPLNVTASTATAYEATFSTQTSVYHVAISTTGHVLFNGPQPILSGCGGSPTVTGTDNAFRIVPGSAASGCTATFAGVWGASPICTVTPETLSLTNALSYTISKTAVTITETSLTSALDVICFGTTGP